MQYRRDQTPGATYFFTVVTLQRWPWFANAQRVADLRQAFAQEKARRPFAINAIVVLPDHLHTIWTLPEGDSDYSTRWRNIKRGFTAQVPAEDRPPVWGSRTDKKKQAIWQRRFWEHRIRDERDFANHVQYIHHNPVKHGYVQQPEDWPYSSIHRRQYHPNPTSPNPTLPAQHQPPPKTTAHEKTAPPPKRMKRFAQGQGFNPVMWAGYRVVLGCTMLGCTQPNLRGYEA